MSHFYCGRSSCSVTLTHDESRTYRSSVQYRVAVQNFAHAQARAQGKPVYVFNHEGEELGRFDPARRQGARA